MDNLNSFCINHSGVFRNNICIMLSLCCQTEHDITSWIDSEGKPLANDLKWPRSLIGILRNAWLPALCWSKCPLCKRREKACLKFCGWLMLGGQKVHEDLDYYGCSLCISLIFFPLSFSFIFFFWLLMYVMSSWLRGTFIYNLYLCYALLNPSARVPPIILIFKTNNNN